MGSTMVIPESIWENTIPKVSRGRVRTNIKKSYIMDNPKTIQAWFMIHDLIRFTYQTLNEQNLFIREVFKISSFN